MEAKIRLLEQESDKYAIEESEDERRSRLNHGVSVLVDLGLPADLSRIALRRSNLNLDQAIIKYLNPTTRKELEAELEAEIRERRSIMSYFFNEKPLKPGNDSRIEVIRKLICSKNKPHSLDDAMNILNDIHNIVCKDDEKCTFYYSRAEDEEEYGYEDVKEQSWLDRLVGGEQDEDDDLWMP